MRGTTMIAPDDVGAGGAVGWVAGAGGLLGVIVTTFLALRKYLSGEAVSTAANAAQTDLINMLNTQLDRANARADAAERSRDEAMQQIRQLKQQVDELTDQVNRLQRQISSMAPAHTP